MQDAYFYPRRTLGNGGSSPCTWEGGAPGEGGAVPRLSAAGKLEVAKNSKKVYKR